jgi:hypothetical protein
VELEIWWMNDAHRRSFRLDGFHRTVMTRADLAAVGSQGTAVGAPVTAVQLPGSAVEEEEDGPR